MQIAFQEEVYSATTPDNTQVTTEEWRSALTTLKKAVDDQEQNLYGLKLRARRCFRERGYRNWLQMAEVFMELYTAIFAFGADQETADGWFFKPYKWWQEHHELTRPLVSAAVGNLEILKVVEKRHGLGNRMYFRLLPAAIIQTLYPEVRSQLF